jgi:tRNA-specific 2-thiouridylase
MKVIVGMSGGVDSSVTAYLLEEQGYEVEGLSFILYEARLKNTFAGCCSVEAINDAQRTAERIGVKHTRLDLRDEFMEKVIDPFIEAYSKGITPNPCILCNRHIKFPHLLKVADERGADFIATGHYARLKDSCELQVTSNKFKDKDSSLVTRHLSLLKGIDPKKDQSYVLYVLRREELNRLVLPLGDKRKDEVREIARGLNLPAANRPESQEICFVEDRNYFKFLKNLTEPGEGQVIEIGTGKVLGKHEGIHSYTIGQRKRLGVATGKPLYVAKIDPANNAIYVGPKEATMIKEFLVEDVNWLTPPIPSFTPPLPPLSKGGMGGVSSFRASVKIRSMMKDEPATISVLENGLVQVIYDEPQWAPAPGQSAVFYDGDVVIGGGVISGIP